MSASNSATVDPNQTPTFTIDEAADPAVAIQELHSHTRNALIDLGTKNHHYSTGINGLAAQIVDIQNAVDHPCSLCFPLAPRRQTGTILWQSSRRRALPPDSPHLRV
ncbi:unnamed protein product [Rhizoctonia solani]|uniref:Uncharacterized protein n=1 Tax=Rhizoctonia solani TaxID=456999 RepID=A0A8H3C2V3_9AGAM|nr:unnamed protein product [Rhizoctonia solani]